MYKNMKTCISLSSPNFIEVQNGKEKSYGGNQSWWEERNKRLKKLGCGVISCSDTELYIMGENTITYESYMQYVDFRFKKYYHFVLANGVPFWKMCFGFWRALKANSKNYFVWWTPTVRKDKLLAYIEKMLANDNPVPASYYVFFKKNGLPLYRYNDSQNKLIYSQDIHSHYFTITGICRDEATEKKYIKLSSWGKCYYAELDAWLKKRSVFSNILYYKKKA